jgi:hypothetical protein
MTFSYRPRGPTKHDRENQRAARRAQKAVKRELRREAKAPGFNAAGQFDSAFPNAPEDAAGVGRTLSRGL